VKINCIGVVDPSPLGEKFMQDLARSNNGDHKRINR